jgi:DNA-binding NarL/FixJ family response regulator
MIATDDIKKAIELAFEIPFKSILKGQHDAVMIPRHLFIALMLEEGHKPKVIAKELNRDRSAISASKSIAKHLLNHNRAYKNAYLVATKYLEDL